MTDAVPVTLKSALDTAARLLAPASPTAALDTEVLLMHVLGIPRAVLLLRATDALPEAPLERFRRLVARRLTGEPVAYLTGMREFWSLPLTVTPAVLIPRPETELLVECALARIARDTESTIADLGTGSGAIAFAIARERPRCHVIATDASPEALDVARDNAQRLGIENIEFRLGEWFAPLTNERFDFIVSNPPYVRSDDPHLNEGDLRFEPKTALDGGPDGLEAIRRIAGAACAYLRDGGWLLLEHGHDQADAVADILHHGGFREILSHRDLTGHVRVAEAR